MSGDIFILIGDFLRFALNIKYMKLKLMWSASW